MLIILIIMSVVLFSICIFTLLNKLYKNVDIKDSENYQDYRYKNKQFVNYMNGQIDQFQVLFINQNDFSNIKLLYQFLKINSDYKSTQSFYLNKNIENYICLGYSMNSQETFSIGKIRYDDGVDDLNFLIEDIFTNRKPDHPFSTINDLPYNVWMRDSHSKRYLSSLRIFHFDDHHYQNFNEDCKYSLKSYVKSSHEYEVLLYYKNLLKLKNLTLDQSEMKKIIDDYFIAQERYNSIKELEAVDNVNKLLNKSSRGNKQIDYYNDLKNILKEGNL